MMCPTILLPSIYTLCFKAPTITYRNMITLWKNQYLTDSITDIYQSRLTQKRINQNRQQAHLHNTDIKKYLGLEILKGLEGLERTNFMIRATSELKLRTPDLTFLLTVVVVTMT